MCTSAVLRQDQKIILRGSGMANGAVKCSEMVTGSGAAKWCSGVRGVVTAATAQLLPGWLRRNEGALEPRQQQGPALYLAVVLRYLYSIRITRNLSELLSFPA